MELRDLPAVGELADRLAATGIPLPRPLIVDRAKRALDRARSELRAGIASDPYALAMSDLDALGSQRSQRVVNATGVLLHTNLGRAPLSDAAAHAAATQAVAYTNLEFDLAGGVRGRRGGFTSDLAASLSGSEAALVVNNNAAALVLAIGALAGAGAVAVSRGELIEIGGSFRLPDLMASTGASLLEIGTTNRTRAGDYERAAPRCRALLKVHPSNYRIDGFTEEATWEEVASVARRAGIPFIADIGSGLLDSRVPWIDGPPPAWLAGEPAVRQTLAAGADVVLFSGDKLLGGPQSGIAVGSVRAIEAMRRHPLARAVRVDGPTLAALDTTLLAYASGDAAATIPFWRMATLPASELTSRLRPMLAAVAGKGEVVDGLSLPGAGTVPGGGIPTPQLVIHRSQESTRQHLLDATPPIVTRRSEAGVVVDLRAVDPADDHLIETALGLLPA